MTHLSWIISAVTCVCYVQATMVNVENLEMEKFTAADSKPARLATVYKGPKDSIASPSRPPANIVYGKLKGPRPYVAPGLKPKNQPKFKPSQEDSGYDAEGYNQYAKGYKPTPQETVALQKYMQKYASQVFAAQKHPSQLSDAQKQVVANDPYKYVAPTPKYKYVPLVSQESKVSEQVKEHDAVEVGTEKYQSVQVHQHVVVQPTKHLKSSPPKKAFSYDSAQQSSDFKYSSQDSHASALVSSEKEGWSSYEPYQSYGQYGVVSAEKGAEYAHITGYKIPASSVTLGGHGVDTKEVEAEEEHYPHHEPKYEYMYQVHDPEKHNNFGHSEARKGKNTWGRYYVQLPDGRLETVKYWVDKSGYHAEVDFKGQAQHPSHKEYAHHEESGKSYPKVEEVGIGGHSEASYSIGEAVEEY